MGPETIAADAPAPAAMDSIADSLRWAARALSARSDSPRLDAELLLCKVLDVPRSALIVRGDDALAAGERRAYAGLITRRLGGAPVAYLTGTREFWSLDLNVTPDVLVPRPETEVLVELALELLPTGETCSVLDLGTGSGAIALAIAAERPRALVTGVDVCDRALAVALANSQKLRLPQMRWRSGSWFEAVPGERFALIAANPPYIADADPALQGLAAEPTLALASGPTGLEALGRIVATAPRHLRPGGWLLLEHGSTQADAVAGMLRRRGFLRIRSRADFSGHPRVTLGTIHSPHQE